MKTSGSICIMTELMFCFLGWLILWYFRSRRYQIIRSIITLFIIYKFISTRLPNLFLLVPWCYQASVLRHGPTISSTRATLLGCYQLRPRSGEIQAPSRGRSLGSNPITPLHWWNQNQYFIWNLESTQTFLYKLIYTLAITFFTIIYIKF